MVLNKDLRNSIIEFVAKKPRSIQEIAFFIGKNWRTADSYVEKIKQEYGLLDTRVFREGTRGALKIVYYKTLFQTTQSGIRDRLFQRILSARTKDDFLPFDIYQYVDENKRNAFMEAQSEYKITSKQNLVETLRKTNNQLMIFSGNLSWARAKQDDIKLLTIFEELLNRGVKIKILVNVNLDSIQNIKTILSLNSKLKSKNVEIRHSVQPFRAFIVDDELVRFKEESSYFFESKNKRKKRFVFYDVFDQDWIDWTQQIFWTLFNDGIGAEKRIKDLETIRSENSY